MDEKNNMLGEDFEPGTVGAEFGQPIPTGPAYPIWHAVPQGVTIFNERVGSPQQRLYVYDSSGQVMTQIGPLSVGSLVKVVVTPNDTFYVLQNAFEGSSVVADANVIYSAVGSPSSAKLISPSRTATRSAPGVPQYEGVAPHPGFAAPGHPEYGLHTRGRELTPQGYPSRTATSSAPGVPDNITSRGTRQRAVRWLPGDGGLVYGVGEYPFAWLGDGYRFEKW